MSIAQTIPPAISLAPTCMTPDSTKRPVAAAAECAARQRRSDENAADACAGCDRVLLAASPLLAHHDWPADRTRRITVTGTVTAFTWADPHVMIALDVQANGTIEKWKVGGSNEKYSEAEGWDRNWLQPGEVITVTGYRFRDGSNAHTVRA